MSLRLKISVALLAGLSILYALFLRRAVLRWGATEPEAKSRLPGDELLEEADGVTTRAIQIAAPANAVWPWLVQIGPAPRGGAYTFDWIENLLGLNMHSAEEVIPEFQHPEVGEDMRTLDGNWVWSFVLKEMQDGTRLISRNRFRLPTLAARIGMLPMEPGSLAMERKMLLGIKQRAEKLAQTVPGETLTASGTRSAHM
jgi:hypothetical protein